VALIGKVALASGFVAVATLAALTLMCPNSAPNSACVLSVPFEAGSFLLLGSIMVALISGGVAALSWRERLGFRHQSGTLDRLPVTFNCSHCGASNTARPNEDAVRCAYCGETIAIPRTTMAAQLAGAGGWSASYLDRIAETLQHDGYSVARGESLAPMPFKADLVASRTKWEVSKFGRFARFVVVVRLNDPSQDAIAEFSSQAADYGVQTARGGYHGSPIYSQSCLVVAVVVTDSARPEVKDWISKEHAERRWKAFDFRVLVSGDDGKVYFCRKTPVWGAAYYRSFADYVERILG
jgi:DNA-directed RNA polymerase subunit RPC12/RpoP